MNFKGRFLLAGVLLAVAWAWALTNYGSFLNEQSTLIQFLAATAAVYLIPSLIVGSLSNQPLKTTAGLFFFVAATDLLVPPLLINLEGVVSKTALLSGAGIDVFLAEIYKGAGVNGFGLFFAVYPLTFIILLFLAALLLTTSELREMVQKI